MGLMRWVEGRLSGRRSKTTCSPADQDFIFHPSPFRQPQSSISCAFEQQFEPVRPSSIRTQSANQLNSSLHRTQSNVCTKSIAAHFDPKRSRPLSSSTHTGFVSSQLCRSSTGSSFSTTTVSSSSSSSVSRLLLPKKRKSWLQRDLITQTPLSTPKSHPLPATPVVAKVTRSSLQSSAKSALDNSLLQSFYSPAHLVHGALLKQKLEQIEQKQIKEKSLFASKSSQGKQSNVDHRWTDELQTKKAISEAKCYSNRKSVNESERDLFPVKRVDSPVDLRSQLQSSISVDSGCPLTCNAYSSSASFMDSSMQSSLISDYFCMTDSQHQNQQQARSSNSFYDSQLNLNELKSIELNDIYDQVPYDCFDSYSNQIDSEEQYLMVDAYGGVHQFTSSQQFDHFASKPLTGSATYRVNRRDANEKLKGQRESGYDSPSHHISYESPQTFEMRRNKSDSIGTSQSIENKQATSNQSSVSNHSNAVSMATSSALLSLNSKSNESNCKLILPKTNNEKQLERMQAKQRQLRRVMDFVLNTSNLDTRNRFKPKSNGNGLNLYKSLHQTAKTKTNRINEVWVSTATDRFLSSFPVADNSNVIKSQQEQTSPSASNLQQLIERQKQLHQQLQALVKDCSSLTPEATHEANQKQPTSTLVDYCHTANGPNEVLPSTKLHANIPKSSGTPNSEHSEHSLHLSNDSGILGTLSDQSSETSSPVLSDGRTTFESKRLASSRQIDLGNRIEQLRTELQSVVKVAIDQIRQHQSPQSTSNSNANN